jgi:hypothetical protein
VSIHVDRIGLMTLADGAPRPVLPRQPNVRPVASPVSTPPSRRRRPWWTPAGWILVGLMYGLAFLLRNSDRVRRKPDWMDDY